MSFGRLKYFFSIFFRAHTRRIIDMHTLTHAHACVCNCIAYFYGPRVLCGVHVCENVRAWLQ